MLSRYCFARAVLWLAAALSAGVQAQETPSYNQISLQAQAQREVVHDVMRVTLYTEAQDTDAARLAASTTETLNAATVRARQTPGVRVQTGGRASYPVTEKNRQRITAWRERTELQLESADFAALAALVAELSADMKIAERHFAISADRRKAVENELIQEAIAAFRARAQLAVAALEGKGYRLVGLNLDSGGFRPRPVYAQRTMMAAAMDASAGGEAQHIEAGSSEVTVTASGVVELQP